MAYGPPQTTGYGAGTGVDCKLLPLPPNQVINMNQLAVIIEQNKEMIELLKTLVEKMGHGFE